MRLRRVIVSSLLGVGLLAPVASEAQNVLANPNFTANTLSWSINGVGASMNHDAGVASNTPGSLRVDNCGTTNGDQAVRITQCVNVATAGLTGASNVTFGADFREGTGTDGISFCFVRVTPHTNASCTAVAGAANQSANVDPVIGSFLQSDNLAGFTVAVGVFGLEFQALCGCPTDPSPEQVFMDDAFLGVGLTPVELQSFSVE